MRIIIDIASNGFRVRTRHLNPEDRSYDENIVIEENSAFDSSKESEADAMQRLLWTVMECIGYCDGKYDKKRVKISLEHGDCYECGDTECDICSWLPVHKEELERLESLDADMESCPNECDNSCNADNCCNQKEEK